MAWDSAAVLMSEIATSIRLLEHPIKEGAITDFDIKSIEEKITEQIGHKYWMTEESNSLDDFLYRERDEKFANEIQDDVYEIKNRIMDVLKDGEIDQMEKKEKIALFRKNLFLFLQRMKSLNGGKLPNHDLELYLRKLSG